MKKLLPGVLLNEETHYLHFDFLTLASSENLY